MLTPKQSLKRQPESGDKLISKTRAMKKNARIHGTDSEYRNIYDGKLNKHNIRDGSAALRNIQYYNDHDSKSKLMNQMPTEKDTKDPIIYYGQILIDVDNNVSKKKTLMPKYHSSLPKENTKDAMIHDQLSDEEDNVFKKNIKVSSAQDLHMVTNSAIKRDGHMPNKKDYEDLIASYKSLKKDWSKKILDEEYSPLLNGNSMRWHKYSKEPYTFNKALEKQTYILDNSFRTFKSMAEPNKNTRDPYFGLYKALLKQYQLLNSKDYLENIELHSETTFVALKRKIQMQNYEESKDPGNLYKSLNRNFKKSNTEDFFKDMISSIVEVLESVIVWVAETLSLPPPAPVNHDKYIHNKHDKYNYSILVAAERDINNIIKLHMFRGNGSDMPIGYMHMNQ